MLPDSLQKFAEKSLFVDAGNLPPNPLRNMTSPGAKSPQACRNGKRVLCISPTTGELEPETGSSQTASPAISFDTNVCASLQPDGSDAVAANAGRSENHLLAEPGFHSKVNVRCSLAAVAFVEGRLSGSEVPRGAR